MMATAVSEHAFNLGSDLVKTNEITSPWTLLPGYQAAGENQAEVSASVVTKAISHHAE
jgi:hypothetical protein